MTELKPIAVVGLGAVLPDAHDVASFWKNLQTAVYSIREVPQGRWDPALYYDPDPSAVDKTYTKIGSWVQDFQFNPVRMGIPIPPKVLEVMDETQQWAIAAAHQALQDYGYPQQPLPNDRVAVILGNALAGEKHYKSSLRIHLPEYLQVLSALDAFQKLPDSVQQELLGGFTQGIQAEIPAITEDTMPGELSNIIAGRVANVFNFGGPNFTTDAACASSLAALQAAVDGLRHYQFDAVLTGGVDRSMSVESYVKFSKIGALSPDGSRPYADGANGFVMGEGAVVFLLKRLEDAERDNDRIYAVIRAIGSSSDGKGKGITAPNPIGQERAMERAWKLAGVSPATAGYVEGHGTSTRVGDVVEVQSLSRVFGGMALPSGTIALGSVKSNIGHLKSAAGAVGMLKTVLALQNKVIPPAANFVQPNPKIDFANLPFRVTTNLESWPKPEGDLRRAGVSAFGFGGTNFHLVLEEYAPGVSLNGSRVFSGVDLTAVESPVEGVEAVAETNSVSFAADEILQAVASMVSEKTGYPVEMLDPELDLEADLGVDTVKQAELFAEVRERYGIPRREDLQLSDYNTLEKVVRFVEESWPGTPAKVEEPVIDNASTHTVLRADSSAITTFILQQVSEKTGYPVEMLDLELDLEADLGIDTVKQAELFAAVREHYGIPRREDLRLSDYNTLEKVVRFVEESLSEAPLEVEEPASVGLDEKSSEEKDPSGVTAFILEQVSVKTGYPIEMLDLELDLEADLGIDTVKQAELFAAVREHYGIPRREDLRLSDYNTLDKVVRFVVESEIEPAGTEAQNSDNLVRIEVAAGLPEFVARIPSYRKMLFLSAESEEELLKALKNCVQQLKAGELPQNASPTIEGCAQQERIAIDFETVEDLQKRVDRAIKAFDNPSPNAWKALSGQGVYRGSGKAGRLAFLFPGQGSQYVNMLRDLSAFEPVVEETFREADRVMTPILGKPLTDYIFVDGDEDGQQQAEAVLRDTTITQPAVLTADVAMLRLMQHYGFAPEMVIGHSLGEYGALVAAGVLEFQEALEIVSARGREMSKISVEDNGCMAAVSAPIAVTERILQNIEEYVVLANINSPVQSVIGGSTAGVDAALEAFKQEGIEAVKIPVSHAFHTQIVAPASEPLRQVIARMNVRAPRLPVAANVTGSVYPDDREEIMDLLARQVASPVQFIQGINTLYDLGARVFIEVGPKRVLSALTTDILGNEDEKEPVVQVPTNHPRKGGAASFNEALCALYAAGVFPGGALQENDEIQLDGTIAFKEPSLSVGVELVSDGRLPLTGSVVISGAGLGLPGRDGAVFREDNIERVLRGDSFIEPLPEETRNRMVEKRVTRLVKSSAGALMVEIDDLDQTIHLAGQRGTFDLAEEFGLPGERVEAYDISTKLAIAAGIEALRDAGIPLMMRYRKTSKDTLLPDRWMLPPSLADETGVIFASAFPGLDHMAEEAERFYRHKNLSQQLVELRNLQALAGGTSNAVGKALTERIGTLEREQAQLDYHFDRRFVFRVLAMGHSQFAEYIGARGPNTAVNAACASTTQAVSLAEDWIRAGRCRRVVIVAGDDVTGGSLVNWVGTGLFATGASTTEKDLRLAALPFDRRRNGMIMGMGAAALVVEAEDAVRERGMRAICEILASQTANSAFHGTRLDVNHVSQVMDQLISQAERRFGLRREEIAGQTMFVSHETYTPARGGSAAAEIHALRHTFGDFANRVVIANTKGFTGHTMGVGVEDVVAVKGLEYGVVPPIAHYDDSFEPDLDLGDLNLSHGGQYPVQYALRLGAGFGSQIAMTLLRHIPGVGERTFKEEYQQWLEAVTGIPGAAVEVVQHTLRVQPEEPPVNDPAQPTWTFGQGPTIWAAVENKVQIAATETAVIPQAPALADTHLEDPAVDESPERSHFPELAVKKESGEIVQTLLAMVSEKTGYPQEMLDLELDLEADLGVDTVKQAELFAAVREHYEIPRREDLQLSDYNTLAKVVRFVEESLPEKPAHESILEQPTTTGVMQAVETQVQESAPVLVRRVPTPVLRPRLDLCLPTGVIFNEQSRVIIIRDQGRVYDLLAQQLRARKAAVLVLEPGLPQEVEAVVQDWQAEGPVQGVFFLPTLDIEASVAEMDFTEWQAELDRRILPLYAAMRVLPEAKFLACGTRFGGLHGCRPGSATGPLGGLASGFAKALSWERPDLVVKVIDFEEQASASVVSATLLEEILRDPGAVEIGREGDQRFGIAALEQQLPEEPGFSLEAGSVFLVSGGTGGITTPVIEDLARETKGTFYLLGRTVLPPRDNPDIQRLKTDRNGLRDELVRRLKESGEKVTPAIVERKLAALERATTCLETMQSVEAAGGKTYYLQCDVLDSGSVQAVVDAVLQAEGRVDVLVHAAGVEHSRRLENKPLEEFAGTIAVKATGFYHLFHSLAEKGALPKAVVAFSSVAGRFGNAGQTDYAAANDLLCKLVSAIRNQYPEMKAIALDWGAWAEVGMASRGFIPNLMARAGIDMLSPAEAAPQVYMELVHGLPGETILAGSLGILTAPREATGGLDLERANEALTAGQPIHVMFSRVTGLDLEEGVILEAELDPKDEPFLRDHALNGTPLLPGVMGIEGFSVAAQHVASVLGAEKGSFKVARLEEVCFMLPFKFYRNEPRQVTWKARVQREETGLVAHVVLESTHTLMAQAEEKMQHFSGKVYLVPTDEPVALGLVEPPQWNMESSVKKEDIYRLYFHGPAFQVLEGVERTNGTVVGKLQTGLPSITAHQQNLMSLPLLVELCMQTAGVYEIGETGALSLPKSIGSLTLHQLVIADEDLFAEVYPRRDQDGRVYFDARVIDGKGTVYLEMHKYQTSSMPYAAEKKLVRPLEILVPDNKYKPEIE